MLPVYIFANNKRMLYRGDKKRIEYFSKQFITVKVFFRDACGT